jgi:hypothetical protein
LLETVHAIAKPDAQMDITLRKDRSWDDGHVWQRGIAKQDGIQPLADWNTNGGRGFTASRAGAVIAPVSGRASCIDKSELKLPRAIEIDTIDANASLVADELRDLGLEFSKWRNKKKRKSEKEKWFQEIGERLIRIVLNIRLCAVSFVAIK